ncbi:Phospholipid translocase [Hyphodiscus hymeniophilus]|uniref:Phospholipid-transporting ATPase n=1 Tax=Hyphodiscus hymeniophilus TaxID=353542 RepID=A0A9P6VJA1_9HELO|nr:Phospholipid translocase [Hyphodiscus hymeniophilus]
MAERKNGDVPPPLSDKRGSTSMEGSVDPHTGRVRFSRDLDHESASANTPASFGQRPGTPDLTLDTSAASASSPPQPVVSSAALPTKKMPASPTSPRARDRGYSLRRSLFARGIHTQVEESPIELVDAESSRGDERGSGERRWRGKKTADSAVTVSPIAELERNPGLAESTLPTSGFDMRASPSRRSTSTRPFGSENKKHKKTATASLPNYDVWARSRRRKDGWQKKFSHLYKTIVEEGIFGRKALPPSKDGRHIDVDVSRTQSLIDERTGQAYIGNSIRSSRYTVWDFVPRQLFFQFSKLANAYFLLVSILQMIPGLSPTGSYTTIAPLLAFVTISMCKEGYDDVRRYKLDKVENNKETRVLRENGQATQHRNGNMKQTLKNLVHSERDSIALDLPESSGPTQRHGSTHWTPLKWKDVKVGEIIQLQRDDDIPADIVLLHADGPNGIAFIETMALDGETNLKTKQAVPPLVERCATLDSLAACKAKVVVEDPNLDLYNFDGRVTLDGETLPLTMNEVVFRGSTLRNTPNAIGMVINTGEECKIRMNANKSPRIKAPALQSITNRVVIMLVFFVIILALFCTIAYSIWSQNVESNAWYLKGAHYNLGLILVADIILFNTLIPLSLYVSLEIIKVGQLLLMKDADMYDPVSNTPTICNTTTILENLGQINYIFSDKTGTLTDNVMRFRKLSVAGYAWLHDFDLRKEAAEKAGKGKEPVEKQKRKKGKGIAKHLSMHSQRKTRPSLSGRNDSEISSSSANLVRPDLPRRGSSISLWRSTARPAKAQAEMRTDELLQYMQYKPHSIFTKKAKFFLLSLALCHTCLPEVQEDGDIEFQAASPDELALVKAAKELGFLIIDRAARSITLNYPGAPGNSETVIETYDVLDVIEFSSKRKRMSIIVRFPNGKICIFCKGADSAVLPRLKLASLALEKASEIVRRASKRKSIEIEEALRRMSEHSPRTSFSSVPRKSTTLSRKSIGHGRTSMASTRLQPIRDELDSWLKHREHDVEVASDEQDLSAYQTPRASIGRLSFASSENRWSMNAEGIDDIIDEAFVLDDAAVFERCFQHIDDFASEGLRTLLFGYRFLDENEYAGWKKIYMGKWLRSYAFLFGFVSSSNMNLSDATTSLVDRQKLIENAGEMIEQSFDLAGATAIEDKLQKGVPETVDKMRRANIKIWMLTGDKRETAINIAYSARICKSYSEVVILDHTTNEVEQRMASTLLDITKGAIPHSVIVVDGATLAEIESNETLSMLFFDLVVVSDSVICCRASPSQKASLVKKIRTKVKGSLTLAIGDGANDIAMIQEAHVGIGISGKEGLQAARISDYSIAQFRFLQKLLLVHGRWNYIRTAKYILVTFWKELLFYLVQALYQKWNGYSGFSLYESLSLTVFNTLFTSLPVIFLGIFEQDLAASTLLAVPELYIQGQRNEAFNLKKYLAWMFMASSEAMIIYFCALGLYGEAIFQKDNSVMGIGQMCFSAAVTMINTKALFLEMHNKTYMAAIGWIVSVGGWWVWTLALDGGVPPESAKNKIPYPIKGDFIHGYGSDFQWWLAIVITLFSFIIFETAISSIRKTWWPTDTDTFQVLQKDPVIRRRFEDTVKSEEQGKGGVEMGRDEKRTSADMQREGEIQELLDRPRIMNSPEPVDGTASVRVAPVSRTDSGNLVRRRFSVDGDRREEDYELSPRTAPKTRHSVDIAKVLGRGA